MNEVDPYKTNQSLHKLHESKEQLEAGINEQEIKLLVVDDNLMNQKYISILLNELKIPFDIASDGQQAVDKYKLHHYDLVFMDLSMPVMDGYEATKIIRSLPGELTPIIALTASTFFSKNDLTLKGMTDFLEKPYTPEELLTMLQKHLPPKPKIKQANAKQNLNKGLDRIEFMNLYGGDRANALDMFKTYRSVIDQELETLLMQAKSGNADAIRTQVHKIKPMFSMVGLKSISAACAQIESELATKNLAEIGLLIDNIADQATKSRSLIDQEIELLENELK